MRPVKILAPRSFEGVRSRTKRGERQEIESGRRTYVNGADEVRVAHQNVCHSDSKNDREDPGTNEPFYCFLWGKLYELRAPEGDSADVGEDVISNDEGGR